METQIVIFTFLFVYRLNKQIQHVNQLASEVFAGVFLNFGQSQASFFPSLQSAKLG